MAEKLEFDLKVGVNELQKAISDATTGSKKLGDTISTAIGTFAGQAAIKGFSLLGDAIGEVGGFLKDSVRAAQQQEDALNKLSQALRSTGEFSSQAVDEFAQFASELQKSSVYGDEVVLGQIAIAKSFGATNQQAKELVQAAINLSATFGTSFESNVRNLGKTFAGLTGELGEALPQLRSLTKEQLRSGEAIRLSNQLFGGAAASELNTYSGSVTALGNAFSDLQEQLGFFVTQSDLIKGAINAGKSAIEGITQAIIDYRTESKLQSQGFVDTQSEIDSLSRKYEELTLEIEKQQAIINKQGPQKSLVSTADIQFAEVRVKSLNSELISLYAKIEESQKKISQQESKQVVKGAPQLTEQETNQLKQFEAQKTQIIAQAELERESFKAQLANESIQNDFDKQQAEITRIAEFERQKAEISFQFAEERARTIGNQALQDAELARIGKAKELELTKIANKQLLAEEQLKNKKAQDSIAFFKKYEDQTNKERIQNLQSTFNTIASLSDSSNRTLAAVGKAAAISTATIDGYVAINKALASEPPPANYALAAAVGAATAANVAKIAGVKFEQGGIVGATKGPDNQLASIRTGEMVLNAEQQKNLFDMINGGGMGGEIVVQIDGREIARAVRSQINAGFKIA